MLSRRTEVHWAALPERSPEHASGGAMAPRTGNHVLIFVGNPAVPPCMCHVCVFWIVGSLATAVPGDAADTRVIWYTHPRRKTSYPRWTTKGKGISISIRVGVKVRGETANR